MSRERKKLIDEIFLSAVELPNAQRQAFLAAACPDEDIAKEVGSLLEYEKADDAALKSVVARTAASLISQESMIGVRLGPYRITKALGRGGMGAVYLAVRDDQAFEKKVAIKVVKRGMDSEAVLDRFRHERRILANLDHPYIGRLLDAGTTPDGRPYFVMEYVAGEPVVAFAKTRKLEVRAVLGLFLKICDAVSYAHRNLIIHRDLKAGNILVSEDGFPKLLDFGIAKLLDPQGQSEATAPSNRMLTLDCASPEQIQGDPVTTSTDIYSLGVLLFELLAGRPPWDLKGTSFTEAAQLICSTTPPKPSLVRMETNGDRHLSGDLDNIVLMALRKDPARRYRSVDEFSEDIRRYQAGLPIIARQDTFAYRAAKFLRRHRVAAAIALTATAGLVAGIVEANIERRRAEVRLTQMLGMANQTLLDLNTQIQHQPGATETRLRITQSTLAYLAGLAKEAGNNQEVRTTLATAYMRTGDLQGYPSAPNMGDFEGALTSYGKAEKLFSGKEHAHLAELRLHRGEVLCAVGHVPECLSSLREGIKEAEKSDSREALVTTAGIYHRMAFVLTQSNPEEALANSRREMEIYTKLAEREPDNMEFLDGLASSYSTTGGALNKRNRLEESLALYRKGVALREKVVARHPNDVGFRRNLMISYGRLGDLLGNPLRTNLGDRAGAQASFQKAQAIAESLAAADPKNNLARLDLVQIRARVGMVMDGPDQARESLALLDSARETLSSLKHGNVMVAEQTRLMSMTDEFRGRRLSILRDAAGALAAYRLSLEEAQAVIQKVPTDSSSTIQILFAKGFMGPELAALGRREEGLRSANEAIAEAERAAKSGPDAYSLAIYVPRAAMWLGDTYEALARQDGARAQRQSDWTAAAASYQRALEAWQKLSARDDYFRFQQEIKECGRRAAECSHKANAKN